MVRGLDIFQEWFCGFEEQYVLIGGTAAHITLSQEGLEFRATKDLDIVLHVEAMTPEFGRRFWEFVKAGAYQRNEAETRSRPRLYRFQRPGDNRFPYLLELFCRAPSGIEFAPPGHLTPIPIDDEVSSLSAILLNDAYYQFVISGRRNNPALPTWIGEDRLIPLKAIAWLEMNARVSAGEPIDSRKINKHLSDILQLTTLLKSDTKVDAPAPVKVDLQQFIDSVWIVQALRMKWPCNE